MISGYGSNRTLRTRAFEADLKMRRFTYHLIYQQLSYRVTVPTIQSVFPPNVLLLVLSSGDQNGFEKRQKLRPLLKEQVIVQYTFKNCYNFSYHFF